MKKIALQLYSVGGACGEDFIGTLRRVREIGYDAVEFAGYHLPADEMKKALDEVGLIPVSSHGNVPDTSGEIAYLSTMGVKHIALPCNSFESYDHAVRFAKEMETWGKLYKEAGISLGYHNHVDEFKIDPTTGKTFMDIFLENCDPELVKMEPDMAWVTRGGENLVEFCRRNKHRIECVHAKDLTEAGVLCSVGSGCVKILEALSEVPHAQIVVEQDGELTDEKWKDLEKSVAFLKKHFN